MKYIFFDENGFLDKKALSGGVYVVDLLSEENPEVEIHLYVGEAGCIVDRCGDHLREFTNNPIYFGLDPDDVNKRDDLILRFCVKEPIEKEKRGRWDGTYKDAENRVKKEIAPITQIDSEKSDRMYSRKKKREIVQSKMRECGLK